MNSLKLALVVIENPLLDITVIDDSGDLHTKHELAHG